jgi:hypothetical protein
MELHTFATRQFHDGDLVGSLAAIQQTVELVESRPTTGTVVGPVWFGLAFVGVKVGRADLDPTRFLRRAEQLRASGEHYPAAIVEGGAAYVLAAQGNIDGALASLERARQTQPRMGELAVLAVALHLATDNRNAAAQEVARLTAQADQTDSPLLRCRALWLAAVLDRGAGDHATALRCATDAAALAGSHGLPLEQINALELAADVLAEAGHANLARNVTASVAAARARMHYTWRILGPPCILTEPTAPSLSLDEARELAASVTISAAPHNGWAQQSTARPENGFAGYSISPLDKVFDPS